MNKVSIAKRVYSVSTKNINLIKRNRRQYQYFSTRLPHAYKKIRELYSSMVSTTYNSKQDMIIKLQSSKGKTKMNFYENISNYYDEMNIRKQSNTFQFKGDPFSKNAESIGKNYQEVLLVMKFLQTKPTVKSMKIKYYDLYYTVIKNRDDNKIVNDEYE